MQKITGKQSRAARALLKWNIYDLTSRMRIPAKRIDSFEKGVLHLQKFENDELLETYKKENIEFTGDFEVKLGKKERLQTDLNLQVEENHQKDEQTQQEAEELDQRVRAALALQNKKPQ